MRTCETAIEPRLAGLERIRNCGSRCGLLGPTAATSVTLERLPAVFACSARSDRSAIDPLHLLQRLDTADRGDAARKPGRARSALHGPACKDAISYARDQPCTMESRVPSRRSCTQAVPVARRASQRASGASSKKRGPVVFEATGPRERGVSTELPGYRTARKVRHLSMGLTCEVDA